MRTIRLLKSRAAWAILAGLLATLGCSGSDLEATVSGTVLLDGQPVGPGVVTFAPAGGGQPAVGQLETDGSYYLVTGDQEGLPPGSYEVAVQAFEPPSGLAPGERTFEPSRPLIPEKFMKTSTSGLQFEVASGHNDIDIQLTTP